MITKLEVRKNRIDLLYNKQLQKFNALLILATTGILSFVGGIIVNPQSFWLGIIIGSLILLASITYYEVDLKPEFATY